MGGVRFKQRGTGVNSRMTISGIASTALDFLATIAPDDPIWDLDSIEVFVDHVQSLATRKRQERETLGIDQAMVVLRAEIAMLPDGELGIDLSLIEGADISPLDAPFVVPRIEALTAAIAGYRQEASRTSDGNPRTIAERAAIYQAMGARLSLVTERLSDLLQAVAARDHGPASGEPVPEPVSVRRVGLGPAHDARWTVGYFLARCGQRVQDRPVSPPSELGTGSWHAAYCLFYAQLGGGNSLDQFTTSLGNIRDHFVAFRESGRQGLDTRLAATPTAIVNEWQYRPREELWEYVKQFVTR